MAVTFNVNLRGAPLRRTYVSHYDFYRTPQTMFFITDEAGSVTVSNANATNTTNPAGPTGGIAVTVHAQNAVVRVLDGRQTIPGEVTYTQTVAPGGTININTNTENQDHFRIMDMCLVAYDKVFRVFWPFNVQSRRAFPFGRAGTIAQRRNRLRRIEVIYPESNIRAPGLAYVEPAGPVTGFPVIHIKHKQNDRRLFGIPDPVFDPSFPVAPGTDPVQPSLIPHELAHALYFTLMSLPTRLSVEVQYLGWLAVRVAAGLPPSHNTDIATTPFIAWIESLGLFAERFFFYRQLFPNLTGPSLNLRQSFVQDELSSTPALANMAGLHYQQVGQIVAGNVVPNFTGENVEGAVYGALLDFANRRGDLRSAIDNYFRTASSNVMVFDEYRNWIIMNTSADTDISDVANTWGM